MSGTTQPDDGGIQGIELVGADDPFKLAHSNLLCYAAIMWPGYKISPHHKCIAEHLEAVERGDIRRLIILAPPRHGKTQLVSEFFAAWYLGRNPDRDVIFATYSQDRADDVGPKVRDLLKDPTHANIFPYCRISEKKASTRKIATLQGGNYFSVGRGASITGRGANVLVLDDVIKDREEADSDLVKRKLKDWFRAVVYTRLMPQNAIVLIQTSWAQDDLGGWLIDERKDEGWTVLRFPAICDDPAGDPVGREVGEALWPDHFPLERLEQIKRTIGTREWSAQYQQRPILAEEGIINIEWFRRYERLTNDGYVIFLNSYGEQEKDKVRQTVQSWDTAFKAQELSDPSVCTTWKVTKRGYCLVDVYCMRVEYPELKKKVLEMERRFCPDAVLIEDKASGQSLIQDLKNTRIPIIPRAPTGDKITRMSAQSAKLEAGRVFLPHDALWLVDYEMEMGVFPYGKFVDQVDSTSQFLEWVTGKRYRKKKRKFWK